MRDELGTDRVVLAVWPDGCIAMWTQERWEELTQQLLSQPKSNADARVAARALGASAQTDGLDRQGRITLPPELRSYAGINKDVMVVGALEEDSQDLSALWGRLNF